MRNQIQGFDDKKLEVFTALKNRSTGSIKNCYLFIPRPPGRTSQGTGEASCPQKRTSSTSKKEISSLFLFIPLLDPDP
jgi:hypothetical protein